MALVAMQVLVPSSEWKCSDKDWLRPCANLLISSLVIDSSHAMDPISALSIATSVVTFIDFTVKVVLLGHEIYQEGTTVGVSEIENRAQELKSWVNGLRAPISGRKDSLKDEYEVHQRPSLCYCMDR